ncbi:MAG: sugar-binding transcriptional regulator [Aggregatilineales bacterium]
MTYSEETRFIAKVAYMYYELEQKQTEIAQQLDISQATVSRMLKQAQARGIVRTTVNMPTGVYAHLENALCEQYGIKSAIVVDCEYEDDDAIQNHIGSAAAYYVETTINKNEVVGISSWSSTLLAMVNAMHPLAKATHAQVVQILGGVGNPSAEIYASRLTERFANLVQGTPVYLPAPGVVGSKEMLNAMLNEQFVQQAIALFDNITLALVGIGSVEPSKLLASSGNVFSAVELDQLRETGAVGDIALRFFDENGVPVSTPLDERVISISMQQLNKVPRTVGIAGGKRKTNAIRSALLGGWINVLITDRHTAERLLDQNFINKD